MNSYIKSHLQLAQVHVDEETPTVEMPFEEGRSKVLKKVRSLHIKRRLLQANKNIEAFIGDQNTDSDDPCGRVLRRMRIQQGLDAFVVASKACITVWQLYELETGKDTLFYTQGLRHKAAQRVAAILGSDWDDILEGRVIAKPISGFGGNLHLLKTPLTQAQLQSSKEVFIRKAYRDQTDSPSMEASPLSSAMFLRVPDVQR